MGTTHASFHSIADEVPLSPLATLETQSCHFQVLDTLLRLVGGGSHLIMVIQPPYRVRQGIDYLSSTSCRWFRNMMLLLSFAHP